MLMRAHFDDKKCNGVTSIGVVDCESIASVASKISKPLSR